LEDNHERKRSKSTNGIILCLENKI